MLTDGRIVLAVLLLCSTVVATGQSGPTAAPNQAPQTAPQTAEVLPSYEGQKVVSVELAGQPELNTQELLPYIDQRANEPFSQAKTNATIKALERKGYQAVEVDIRPEADGIRLLFVLQPAFYFGIYTFPEATRRFAYSRLLQVSDYPPRGPYTTVDINSSQEKLVHFFEENGYFQAEVKPQTEVDKQHGIVNVIYHANLGKLARFGNVDIEGASPEQTARLQRVVRSWRARLRSSALIKGKRYSLKQVQNATTYLNTALIKDGYLGAQVKLAGAEYDTAANRADIHFNVNAGPKVHTEVIGVRLWSWTRRNLLPVYQQAGINTEIIQEGRQNLLSYMQKKGFFDAQVTADLQQQAGAETIIYRVTRGRRHRVTNVEVAGNHHLSSEDLLPSVTVEKRRRWWIFSHGRYSRQLERESARNLTKIYQASGYSSVQVTPQISNRDGNIEVIFHVNEGPLDTVQSLRVEGNNTRSISQLAPNGLKVSEGQAFSQKLVDEDRSTIVAYYLVNGYLNASFRATAGPVDKNHPHEVVVVYHITEGPQVRIAQVNTLGRQHTRQEFISKTVGMQTEKPLRQDQLLINEDKLYNLGIFDWSEIDPRRAITTQSQEDVLVKVHEAKRNAVIYSYGFEIINRGGSVPGGTVVIPGVPPVGVSENFKTSEETFYGPRGSVLYTRKNIRGKAENFSASGFAGRLDQRVQLSFEDPHFRTTDWSSQLSLQGEHDSENPIFTSRSAQVGWQLQRALNPDKTNNLFLRYDFSKTDITRLLIPDLISPQDEHVRLSTLSANFVRDTRDNVLDAHKGMYASYDLDFNPQALGSSVGFTQLVTQTAYYKAIPFAVIWANSLRIAIEEPFPGSQVPLSELFFSGGGGSLRGFPLNGAGPQRTLTACGTPGVASTCSLITVPTGGKQLLIVNSEFRIPVPFKKGLSVVPFYDGGNVFAHVGFHGQYTNSIGGGIRYATPVGPIRFDVGHNLNAPPGIKSTQYFVSLGQAF